MDLSYFPVQLCVAGAIATTVIGCCWLMLASRRHEQRSGHAWAVLVLTVAIYLAVMFPISYLFFVLWYIAMGILQWPSLVLHAVTILVVVVWAVCARGLFRGITRWWLRPAVV